MIADYTNNPQLFEQCINLIDESFPADETFPGCKEFAFNGIKYKASWNELSTPFIVQEDGEVIAHAGVWPITLMLDGKEHETVSIHGVCVKPKHRGKGHFKTLMQEVMQYVENKFDSSVLFTIKPYLYKNYPYKIMLPEYDFVMNERIKFNQANSDLRVLNLDNSDDLNKLHNLLSTRVPLSDQLSIINKSGKELFILNTLYKKLYYSQKLNALIIFDIVNSTLYIKEIISPNQCKIIDIIESIPGNFSKIILQFCPDRFLDEKDYEAILAGPECCIMASRTFLFNGKYFRYPELYWC